LKDIVVEEEEEGKITVVYNDKFISQVSDISSCLPIYINEIPQIDHTLDSASLNNNPIGPLTDDVIINNSSIAHFIMIFAEIYLAYRFASKNILLAKKIFSFIKIKKENFVEAQVNTMRGRVTSKFSKIQRNLLLIL
jgi:hypothetical protein